MDVETGGTAIDQGGREPTESPAVSSHCRKGHPRTDENTRRERVKNKTYPRCLVCLRESERKKQAKRNVKRKGQRAFATFQKKRSDMLYETEGGLVDSIETLIAFGKLDPLDREALIDTCLGGMEQIQVAKNQGVSLSTVERRISRAKKQLVEELGWQVKVR